MVPFAQPSDPVNALQAGLVVKRATERVTRVCRIDHHTTRPQDIDHLIDQPCLRRLRMNLEILAH